MQKVLLSEGYLTEKEMRLILYERLSKRYGWLPSQIKNESAEDVEGYLVISSTLKDEGVLNGKDGN